MGSRSYRFGMANSQTVKGPGQEERFSQGELHMFHILKWFEAKIRYLLQTFRRRGCDTPSQIRRFPCRG
jgi:hypothetical protein